MRLKSIKLAGFKSFVDPTSVHFPSNLCAVVGPNGCGKSNVIDAVRWVMGESSAKHLRGESMTDVIFNGSGGRKPVGQASIELIFDNSDGTITGEFAAYNEISVKRKVTRDGQNSYYLNGNKCRRRDITDIFLGTGLGPRSYAIIEQGMISRLIEAKPEELRIFIEEAAGISKYKERRRDTENRIRRTMENLERLTDIRDELGRQLSRLERQAKAAEKYAEYKAEERQVKAEFLALRWRELDRQSTAQKKKITDLELEQERYVTERAGCDTKLEKLRIDHSELGEAFNQVQGKFYAVGAEVARIEQSIQHAQQRARDLHQDMEQTERNYAESEQHLRSDKSKIAGWEAELAELGPELERLQEAEAISSEALAEAELAMQDWQTAWDEFNSAAIEPRQQAEVQQSRIQHLEQVIRRLNERKQRIESEMADYIDSPAQEELKLLQEELAELELAREAQQQTLADTLENIDTLRGKRELQVEQINDLRSELQQAKGREASLLALQSAAMGGDENQRAWLASANLFDAPRLAQTLQVESGWEKAVETVLGSYLQAVAVDDLGSYQKLLGDLQQGAVTLYAKSAAANSSADSLASKVTSNNIGDLLAGVKVADDLNAALVQQSKLGEGESIVTRDGIWLGANWLRVSRDEDASAGVIERQQQLQQLEIDIAALEQKIATSEADKQAQDVALKQAEQQRETINRAMGEQQRSFADVRSKVSACEVQIEQFAARKQRAENELAEIARQLQQEDASVADARMTLQSAIDRMESDTARREELLTERDQHRGKLDALRQEARHNRDRLHEISMRERSLTTQLGSIKEGIVRLDAQVLRLTERREQLKAAFSEADDPTEELKAQLEEQLENRVVIEEKLAEARRAVEEVEHEMREQEKNRSRLENQINDVRNRLEQQRLGAQELATRSKGFIEQLEEIEASLEELIERLPEEANIDDWQQQLDQIAARITRLGPINLAAVEEYKVESERKVYLDQQNDELQEALETLQNAIRKIDRETRTRFKETFDKVNHNIQQLFPKLFGGGHAYLEMTGEDLLDTGVSLMARPPGKKNASIHLLSGGEKALTAIAMVFSIFQLNPAPFCMLDEVDAPLDDANVGRYANMVREMSDQVQFIYITHNKISMEVAEHLMGVTMHEPGVSRLVTVDVNQAAALAEA